jgi:hypothetical protein
MSFSEEKADNAGNFIEGHCHHTKGSFAESRVQT